MKKILVIILAVFSLGVITVKADNDRVITKDALPAKAQQFVNAHFASVKISYIKEDRDFFDRNYELVFADGSKIEFGRNGEWVDVDCRYNSVPQAIVPDAIKAYVKSNFPDVKIIEIERKRANHEVKLSNKLELVFDKNLKIKGIDD
ncbi:MAG: PepSY-like domain-containing protein [Bacteroidaceae bacterium]|nr:PepSY-like domain-containing protein [Bacteroidaceae bacterium]